MAGTALPFAKKIISNKWFWIAVAVIIVIVIIRRNSKRLLTKFGKDYGDYTDGVPSDLSNDQIASLKNLALAISKEVGNDSWWETAGTWALLSNPVTWWAGIWVASGETELDRLTSIALNLSDGELKYLANYYFRAVRRGESRLGEDVGSSDLEDRLAIIGEL